MPKKIKVKIIAKIDDRTAKAVSISQKIHPKYKKSYKLSKKYLVHDPDNISRPGQEVEIIASRPISKNKKFIINKQ